MVKPAILRLKDFPVRRIGWLGFQSILLFQNLLRHVGRQPDSLVRWDEFKNKIRAFQAFEYADLRMRLSNPANQPLSALVSKAEKLAPHLSPFAIEGIGYHLAKSSLARGKFETDLPMFDANAGLPVRTLVLLHAGLGLALAESVLWAMNERPSDRAFLLDRFAQVCRQHSHSGYTGVTFEALGLVARALHPHLIEGINRNLSSDLTHLAYFWHGVGRGIYFAPENVSPSCSAPWKALAMCLSEPFHDLGRQNAMAGLAWAMTIINTEDPRVLEAFVRHHGRHVMEDPAFIDGAGAATIFREYISPQVRANPEELFRCRVVPESM